MGFFSGFGSFLNDLTGISSQQNNTYKQQIASMQAQNAYNSSMWQKQNEYNSPSAQLARMREAGIDINPTSYALGTGNLSNTATFVGSENGFSGSGSPAGNPISMALGVANGIADVRNRNASTRNIEQQTRNTEALTEYSEEHARKLRNDNDFFEKHGYYPTTADTPVGSGYETGLFGDILGAIARGKQKYEERIKNNT